MMHKFVIENGKVLYSNKKAAREVENYIAKYGGFDLLFLSLSPTHTQRNFVFNIFFCVCLCAQQDVPELWARPLQVYL